MNLCQKLHIIMSMEVPFIHKISCHACLFLLLTLGATSCQMPKVLRQTNPTMPATFDKRTDTVGIAGQSWRTFFADEPLVALIDTALAGNLDLLAATQRIEQARATVDYTRGFLAPQVSAVASAGVDRYGRNTLNGVGNFDTNLSENVRGDLVIPNPTPDFFLGARSSWEIDIWGKLRNRRKAAYLRLLASEEGRRAIVTGLVADVARHYYTLLALDGESEIIRKNIDYQSNALELVRVQKQAGRVTELAVQQFAAQLLDTRSRQAQVQQQIIETENRLNRLLGRYPQPIRRGQSLQTRELPGQVAAGLPAQMLLRRPDIRQAERQLRAAHVDVDVARAEFLPSLNLTGYVGLNTFRLNTLLNPASLATGLLSGLSAPVFNRRFMLANYRGSVAQSQEAFYRYRQTIVDSFSEVANGLRGLENYRDVAELQTEQVQTLTNGVNTANDLFRSGYATYLEVITAQRNVLEAELNLINTKRAQFLTLTDLYRSLGGGWQ